MCMEFYYYACGEDRDGYNVFATKQECTSTCVPQGIQSNTPCIQAEIHHILKQLHHNTELLWPNIWTLCYVVSTYQPITIQALVTL